MGSVTSSSKLMPNPICLTILNKVYLMFNNFLLRYFEGSAGTPHVVDNA